MAILKDKTEEWDMNHGPVFAYHHNEEGPHMRSVLYDFAIQMEMKLRKNDSKTSWRELPVEALFKLLMLEVEEFKVAHEFLGKEEACKELVDIANYAMILHDRISHEK